MSDIRLAINLTDIENGAWSRAAAGVAQGQNPTEVAWQALFAATWWLNHDHAARLLDTLPDTLNNPGAIFAQALAKTSLGDIEAIHRALSVLKRKAPEGAWFSRWLILENLGALGDYRQQAESLGLGLKRFGNKPLPDWIFLACYRGLDRSGIDPEPMVAVLEALGDRRPDWANALLARLTGQNVTSNLLPKKNNSALLYFIVNAIDSSLIDPVPALFEKLLESGGANYVALSRCLALMLDLDMLPPASAIETYLMRTLPHQPGLRGSIASFFLIERWMRGDTAGAYKIVQENSEFLNTTLNDTNKGSWIFFSYILNLCAFWQKHTSIYINSGDKLTVIGESHALSPIRTTFMLKTPVYAQAKFIMGVKMYHLGSGRNNYRKSIFRHHVASLEKDTRIMLTIGEIDCRINEGIWSYAKKNKLDIGAVVRETVEKYISFVHGELKDRDAASIIIQGIPAPANDLVGLDTEEDQRSYLGMIALVNNILKASALTVGWSFLDVYAATAGPNGRSTGEWHLDGYHLKPSFYQQADRWLVGPDSGHRH